MVGTPMRLREINPWTDRDVEAHWDHVADIYVDSNDQVSDAHDQRFTWAVNALDLKPGISILNITSRDCGSVPYLTRACSNLKIINAEISSGLMHEASKRNPEAEQVKLADYENLPFPDHSFDRILCLETLEHVSKPLTFLSELRRILLPGKIMVLSCPPASCEWSYRLYTRFFGGHGEGPHRFLSSREVKAMLTATGWNLLRHEGTLLLPAGPAWLQRWGEALIKRSQHSFISELGIRQFYVCSTQQQK